MPAANSGVSFIFSYMRMCITFHLRDCYWHISLNTKGLFNYELGNELACPKGYVARAELPSSLGGDGGMTF